MAPRTTSTRRGQHRAVTRKPQGYASILITVVLMGALGIVGLSAFSSTDRISADDHDNESAIEQAELNRLTLTPELTEPKLPENSGNGKRIVFDQDEQRVWLVDGEDNIKRTYLVSGSKLDNVKPGKYKVQEKFRHVQAYDRSGSMDHFVQFTRGQNAAIGFHDLPQDQQGEPKQDRDELGEPRSDGCVRQWEADALALWKFAKIGTRVVVTS